MLIKNKICQLTCTLMPLMLTVFLTQPLAVFAADAGSVKKQIELQQKKKQPRKLPPKIEEPESRETQQSSGGQVEFFVKDIQVSGNTLIEADAINELFATLIGTNVSIDELKLAIDDSTLSKEMRNFSRDHVLENFDIRNTSDRYQNLYESLM